MRNTRRIDYSGVKFGSLTLTQPSTMKREWIARCERGHETTVRPDQLKRTLSHLIQCSACRHLTPATPAKAATLTPAQAEALELLQRSLALTSKALAGTLAVLSPASAPAA